MTTTEDQTKESAKIHEKIFLLCDQCLWTVTCINRKYLEELSDISETEQTCPVCNKDQLSSFPVSADDSYRYSYSKNRGLEVTIKNRRQFQESVSFKHVHQHILLRTERTLFPTSFQVLVKLNFWTSTGTRSSHLSCPCNANNHSAQITHDYPSLLVFHY